MRGALLAAAFLVSALPAAAGSGALPRATADRPDVAQGPQIHVVYAVASDGTDRGLDTNGTIEASVRAWNGWLAGQTGGKGGLRIDTSAGSVDITFVPLPETDAQIAARGAFVRDELERLLHAAGLNAPDKVYAVYYDGTSTFACGGGAWPPTLPGNVAAMYLHGLPSGPVPCDRNPIAPNGQPGYIDFSMLHELLHTLGFVPTCATHHTRAGHVSDATNDLMYAGDAPWQLPPLLDVGHDDYFAAGRAGCLDLAASPYLEGSPPPVVVKPKPKPKPVPRCKKGQKPTKKKPCRRRTARF